MPGHRSSRFGEKYGCRAMGVTMAQLDLIVWRSVGRRWLVGSRGEMSSCRRKETGFCNCLSLLGEANFQSPSSIPPSNFSHPWGPTCIMIHRKQASSWKQPRPEVNEKPPTPTRGKHSNSSQNTTSIPFFSNEKILEIIRSEVNQNSIYIILLVTYYK